MSTVSRVKNDWLWFGEPVSSSWQLSWRRHAMKKLSAFHHRCPHKRPEMQGFDVFVIVGPNKVSIVAGYGLALPGSADIFQLKLWEQAPVKFKWVLYYSRNFPWKKIWVRWQNWFWTTICSRICIWIGTLGGSHFFMKLFRIVCRSLKSQELSKCHNAHFVVPRGATGWMCSMTTKRASWQLLVLSVCFVHKPCNYISHSLMILSWYLFGTNLSIFWRFI